MCDLVKMSLSDDPYAPVVTDTYQTDCTAGLPSPETVISRMSIHFQVIVDIARHSVYGVEALARSSDGTPTPALIQRAEEEGWYPRLEFALLTLAMEAASQLPPHLVCTLNMSASAITDEPVRHLMRRHSDRHWGLEILEFSHRVPIDNTFRDRLREFDCDLLIDDAGEGYSDVQRIREMVPTIVKIDRKLLLDAMDQHPCARARLDNIIAEAQAHGSALLAEGVETSCQLGFARSIGCTYAQGYYIGYPGPIPETLVQIQRLESYFRQQR